MRIDRVEVSGGFLDGLKLGFSDGLNVLIGARGAGKTSVLELIRFALGVPAMTADAEAAAQKQALAVLADGTVSVCCSVQGEQLVFTRSALDDAPTLSAAYSYAAPLIVSQNEIEAIGLDPASRRAILDRLVDPLAWIEAGRDDAPAAIASLQGRLDRLRGERDQFLAQVASLEGLAERLSEAESEQTAFAAAADETKPLQKAIATQSDKLGQIRAAADAYRIAEDAIGDWQKELKESKVDRPIPKLPSAALEAQITASISKAREHIQAALKEVAGAQKLVSRARTESRSKQSDLQAQLKADADSLEKLQRGAGEVGRRVSALRQQLKEQEGYRQRVAQLEDEILSVVTTRDRALTEAETGLDTRYVLRRESAAALTSRFHGRIEVRVEKSGEFAAYEAALVRALQGSNLQYKPLAATLAEKVSPRELIAAVESSDADGIANAARISKDRAVRLVAHLQQQSIADLLLAPLDDAVDFALLDGQDYKPTKSLSMGQRCTVVLPMLLAGHYESILLDQPEDHLDNAFIVETLVEAIRERVEEGQVIVATHNANIPVLGEAQQIIVLASDGRRGFVSVAAPLDDDAAVTAITTLMEGGHEAFERRAAFYSAHPQ